MERAGYERLFAEHSIPIDARDASALVLFPEMDSMTDVPEITTSCWNTLGRSPDSVMCACYERLFAEHSIPIDARDASAKEHRTNRGPDVIALSK
jgi:hypothetical protein